MKDTLNVILTFRILGIMYIHDFTMLSLKLTESAQKNRER